ncbi:hypothetical protein K2X05_02080 [bacterium]|nr:hypothetical protein [bacterium]
MPGVAAIRNLKDKPEIRKRKKYQQKNKPLFLKEKIMFTKQKKDPVISAISAIQTILDVATVAGIPLDKNLSQDSLALWVNLTDGLYDIMDGEAMGIMFALILEFAHKGYALNDIKSIQLGQSGNDFSLKLLFKDESSGTATFH